MIGVDALLAALKAATPKVSGIVIGDPADIATWTVEYASAPSSQETAAMQAVLAGWPLQQAILDFAAQVELNMGLARTRGHLFTAAPLAGRALSVRPNTDDALNWLTLFTFAKDECDLGNAAQPYPGPLTDANGQPVTGLTWQNVLDAMRELRAFGLACVANAVQLGDQAAACASVAAVQALDPAQGWPS